MPKKSHGLNNLPLEVERLCLLLGDRIQIARKRRRMTQDELASRVGVSRQTVYRIEQGDASIAWGLFLTSVWIMGLAEEFQSLLSPDRDGQGLNEELRLLKRRVRKSKSKKDDFDPSQL